MFLTSDFYYIYSINIQIKFPQAIDLLLLEMCYTINVNITKLIPIVLNLGRGTMHAFTVSLFGHREIDDLRRVENRLVPRIREIIRTKPYVVFLIGRNGDFDIYAASVVKRVQKEMDKGCVN